MLRTITLAFLSLSLVVPLTLTPQEAFGEKVAVIHLFTVIRECSEGKTLLADFQKKMATRQEELAKKNNEIQTLQRQLVEQGAKLNPLAQRMLNNNIETKNTQLKREQEDAQKEFNNIQQGIFNGIVNKLIPVLQKFAAEQKISMILDSSKQNAQFFYVAPEVDITRKVIESFNASLTSTGASAP